MKLTLATLLALSAAVSATSPKYWYDEICDSQKTVTKTVYINGPGPGPTPPPGAGINPPKEITPPQNKPQQPGHNKGNSGHWKHHKGGKKYPKKEWPKPEPKPDIPPVAICTLTEYAGPNKPPVTKVETVTNEKIVRPVQKTVTTTITKTVGGAPAYETVTLTETDTAKTETCYIPPRQTHYVKVGGKKEDGSPLLEYTPPVVWAKKDDLVIFDFLAINHTVTESSFANPCQALPGGFKSGFRPNEDNGAGEETFEMIVDDEDPHYVYCGQKAPVSHCEKGMVFILNPKPEKGIEKFIEAAKATAGKPAPENPSPETPEDDGKDEEPRMEIPVIVGGKLDGSKGLVFSGPDGKPFVKANPGDKILFKFRGPAHTVTQSSFENPCEGINKFATGRVENTNDAANDGQFVKEFVVPEGNTPLWFYCGIKEPKNHCKEGMVFAINAPETGEKTFEKFLAAAKNSTPKPPTDTPTEGEDNPPTPSPSTPPTVTDPQQPAPQKTIIVKVGGKRGGDAPVLKFTGPDGNPFVDAKPGDIIDFHMGANKHTVTQSSFDKPCESIGQFKTEEGGVSNPEDKDGPEFVRRFTVPPGDKPLWFYCGIPTHCQKGMVFAINAPKEGANTFEEFLAKAKASPPKAAPPAASPSVGTDPATYGPPTVGTDPATYGPPPKNSTVGTDPATYGPPTVGTDPATYGPPTKNSPVGTDPATYGPPTVGTDPATYGPPTKNSPVGTDPATYGPPTENPPVGTDPATYAPGKTHMVQVGGKRGTDKVILDFSPPFVLAKKGDNIAFTMGGLAHTVTESSFDTPCSGISGDAAFRTGRIENPTDSIDYNGFVKIMPPITDEAPRWFYCGVADHCQKGMVFAINPTPEKSFVAFQMKAMASPPKAGTNPSGSPSSVSLIATPAVSAAPASSSASQ